jgi:superfamily II DNA or RNA helicase
MKINKLYKIYIYEKYIELKKSEKILDNNDLWKIFEWLSCIKLSKEYNKIFYEYSDIDPTFKEKNQMSQNDTGIDCCDMIDTIVQCKLRKDTLTWKDCSTFFGSINIFDEKTNEMIIRWKKLIITRNEECKLSENLLQRSKLFIDKPYKTSDIINYCEKLLINPPKYPKNKNQEFELRDYQVEAINLIRKNKINTIISLPTGCGKNVVIIYSMKKNNKYLILVPRIILMEQLMDEIIRHKPELKNTIQCIGDNNNDYDESKNIIICVYNSISILEPYFKSYNKIYIDEAHHIDKPMIYENEEEIVEDTNDENELLDDEYYSDMDDEKDEVLVDDSEDEMKETTGYNNIIKTLNKYNNNVYLSATIDEIKGFTYYKKDIRDMVEEKYLCDYNIHIPIFSDDITNKNICEHLIKNYRNIIIYCNSQKEGKTINTLMNTLQKGCSEYIDCNTSKTKRNNIIKKYKEGLIPFLVNVRILVEGFDAPITKGICFMHLPSSKTTLIQIIGRALRLHPLKTIAHIILPYSCKEDESNINNFLKVMANNDKRIKQSYENKKLGGYISIENTIEDIEDDNKEFEFRYNMIFDNMGKLLNGSEIWINHLEEVKQYIDKNNMRPSYGNKNNKVKFLSKWLSDQFHRIKKRFFKQSIFYDKWNEFISDEKYKKYLTYDNRWLNKLNQIKSYIDINNKRPSQIDEDIKISSLGSWLSCQLQHYSTKKYIMKNSNIRNKWDEFIEKYKIYLLTNEDIWFDNLSQVKTYIDINNKRPSSEDNDKPVAKLGRWILTQIINYSTKKTIMLNKIIYNNWTEFINNPKYIEYFKSNEYIWFDNLSQVKTYIDINNKRPSSEDKNDLNKALGRWILTQTKNYSTKKEIMSNEIIYNSWTEFINNDKYKIFFKSNEELWLENLNLLKEFIDNNNNIPSYKKDKILYKWLSHQKMNFKNKTNIMQNKEIYDKLTEFINDPKYKKYFITDKKDRR